MEPCTAPKCVGGTCTEVADDSQAPTEDQNLCTDDTCNNGVSTHTNNTADCGAHPPMTHCEGGVCIGCQKNGDCDLTSACRTWACIAGQCVPTNGPTVLFSDPAGDCSKRSCTPDGMLIEELDSTDIPADDGNSCTKEECGPNKEPLHTPLVGQACGVGPSCSSGTAKAQDTCDPNGACQTGEATPCAPFTCGAVTCKESCTVATQLQDCVGTAYCDGAACKNKGFQGDACSAGFQCLSVGCFDGVCCLSPCLGSCVSCNVNGVKGLCSSIPNGLIATCGAGFACMDGNCANLSGKKAVGQTCQINADCFNHVNGGFAECQFGLCRLNVGQSCEVDNPHYCATNLCDPVTLTCQECTNNNQCPSLGCDTINKRCYLGSGSVCGAASDCVPGHACTNNICQ